MTRKLTLEDMKKAAKERGGQCLSTTYINAKTNLLWECKNGHQWESPYSNIHQGNWCRKCYDEKQKWTTHRKYTIADMHKIASMRGGRCLSSEYVNNRTPLEWECFKGHRWMAIFAHIQIRGQWCPVCSQRKKHTIEEMQQLAKSRGGNCLSSEYLNSRTRLLWKCKQGHKWFAMPTAILQGTWCPTCGGNSKKMKMLRKKGNPLPQKRTICDLIIEDHIKYLIKKQRETALNRQV